MSENPPDTDPVSRARAIRVSVDQVSAARALIRLRGGEQRVDELIRRIANAPSIQSAVQPTADQVDAARALVRLRGGLNRVDDAIAELATSEVRG